MMCSGVANRVRTGDKIILGRHRFINGRREVWNDVQEKYLGQVATIKSITPYQGRRYVQVKENSYHWLLLDAILVEK